MNILFLVVVLGVAVSYGRECPEVAGFQSILDNHGTFCYLLSSESAADYTASKQECNNRGLNLASFRNASDYDALLELVSVENPTWNNSLIPLSSSPLNTMGLLQTGFGILQLKLYCRSKTFLGALTSLMITFLMKTVVLHGRIV